MLQPRGAKFLLFSILSAGTTACASVSPLPYSGLKSSPYLTANAQDSTGSTPYRYAPAVNWRDYSRAIIDPVTVYNGPDNQFANTSDGDKKALARHMETTFARKLQGRFQIVRDPAPKTIRVRLTLTGATTTTPVLGPFTHLDMTGNVYNVVQAVRGREGLIAGSALYAVEISDATTNKLLTAYVTKQFPGALNIMASFGSLEAAKVGIAKGADGLLAQLQ